MKGFNVYAETVEHRLQQNERNTHMSQRRKAIAARIKYDLTMEEWESCKNYFGNRCAYCGAAAHLTRDHVIPVIKSGAYTASNILPACGRCNVSKCSSSLGEWYPKQSFYSKERENTIIKYLVLASLGKVETPCTTPVVNPDAPEVGAEEVFAAGAESTAGVVDNTNITRATDPLPKTTKAKLCIVRFRMSQETVDRITFMTNETCRTIGGYIDYLVRCDCENYRKQMDSANKLKQGE